MEKLSYIKLSILGIAGYSISYFTELAFHTQLFFIVTICDIATGYLKALYFKKSEKSTSGAFKSNIAILGLIKKCAMIVFLYLLWFAGKGFDISFYIPFCWAFIAAEFSSIIENIGLMGIKLPKQLVKMLDVLTKAGD